MDIVLLFSSKSCSYLLKMEQEVFRCAARSYTGFKTIKKIVLGTAIGTEDEVLLQFVIKKKGGGREGERERKGT